MTNRKYTTLTLVGMITLLIIFIYNFTVAPTKAYADNITEAQVSPQTTSSQPTSATQVTTQKAPVSIAVYSNEVTESSDTYYYKTSANLNINPTTNVGGQSSVVSSTPKPNTNTSTTVTKEPQSTAAPEATPEPDIITYPPTVAPPYKD